MGTEDQFWASFEKDDRFLEGKGLNIQRETFPGGHDWTVWRRCIRSLLPELFK
jgi:enterochelin esterase-like enzyme